MKSGAFASFQAARNIEDVIDDVDFDVTPVVFVAEDEEPDDYHLEVPNAWEVECWNCGESELEFYATDEQAYSRFRASGWKLSTDGRWFCPECSK